MACTLADSHGHGGFAGHVLLNHLSSFHTQERSYALESGLCVTGCVSNMTCFLVSKGREQVQRLRQLQNIVCCRERFKR